MAEIHEEISAIREAPVIDTKRAQVGVNVSQEMLTQLPTARRGESLILEFSERE